MPDIMSDYVSGRISVGGDDWKKVCSSFLSVSFVFFLNCHSSSASWRWCVLLGSGVAASCPHGVVRHIVLAFIFFFVFLLILPVARWNLKIDVAFVLFLDLLVLALKPRKAEK